jgi:hypothetical protein
MTAPFLREHPNGVTLAVKVQPRAVRNRIGQLQGAELKISVAAPPVEDAANDALLRFLGEVLGCPRGHVQLLRGRASRHKTVLVQGLSPAAVLARLRPET